MTARMPVQTLYSLREAIKTMRDTCHMSWREIGQNPIFNDVSFATLNAIYRGREPGKKVRIQIGIDKPRKPKPIPPAWVTRGADFLAMREREMEAKR